MSRRLLIVSSIRWDYLWQRHQALAVAAAEDGWQVDFLEPHPRNIRQIVTYPLRRRRGAHLTQKHAPPHPGIRVLGLKHWLSPHRLGPYDLALVYLPDRLTEWFLRRARVGKVVYDAVLDWASVPRDWFPPAGWRGSERRLSRLPRSTVITDAPGMGALLATRGITATVVLPAADPPFIEHEHPPFEQRRAAALYFGSVRDELDVQVLGELRRAGLAVDVIGRAEDPELEAELGRDGIAIQPPLPLDAIAAAAGTYRALVLPYRGARASSLVPAKTWNCIATGSWVVTKGLSLPELATVVATSSAGDFVDAVSRAMTTTPPRSTWCRPGRTAGTRCSR